MKNIKVIVPIISVLIGLGVGFFGGMEYRNYQIRNTRGNFQRFVGGRIGSQGEVNSQAFRGGAIDGSVISMDDKSMTVKMNDGSTKIVLLSGSTSYSNTVAAAKTDLKAGDSVAVFGTPNSDGSVTASDVQLRLTVSK